MMKGYKSKTISVRPIANGFIKSETTDDGANYSNRETFHETMPSITADPRDRVSASDMLKDAMQYASDCRGPKCG